MDKCPPCPVPADAHDLNVYYNYDTVWVGYKTAETGRHTSYDTSR